MNKLMYKPLSLVFSVAGGVVAGAVFKKVWKLVADEDEAPSATSPDYGWGSVLAAAALQGAIFAVVKAVVHRGSAIGTSKVTGHWPD